MISTISTILCFVLLLLCINQSMAHPTLPSSNEEYEISEESGIEAGGKCQNGGTYDADEEKCKCNKPYAGNLCQLVISKRCVVRSPPKHSSGCPVGQWCFPDNINCYFYECRKTMGWCIPSASGMKHRSRGKPLVDQFSGELTF
uniref:EGF-like domain-containing protein n=1 Tax=Plectus sambesii TaxID=2011161 RepID=A0A914XGW3_9BILA